jgi:hypothetical protein
MRIYEEAVKRKQIITKEYYDEVLRQNTGRDANS